MREVSDAFLLNMAEVSAALIGLFLVGVFFYIDKGFGSMGRARRAMEAYFRSGTRIVLVLFAFPLGLSLTLVVLELAWSRWLFALLSLMVIASNVVTFVRMLAVARATGVTPFLFVNEAIGSLGVLLVVTVPWILGGLHPTREDLTWAILLAFATAFISLGALVLSTFESAALEEER